MKFVARRKHSNDFWLGRFVIEVALAVHYLEREDVEAAYEGLKEVIDDFRPDADADLTQYLNEIRRDSRALTPATIPYRGDAKITGQEIASKI